MTGLAATLGYVVIGTTDVEKATDFYRTTIQLDLSERREDTAFLRGGTEHHWIRLVRAQAPGWVRAGFRATSPAALHELTRRLDARGVPWEEGGDLGSDRVEHYVRFRDPDGIEVELFDEILDMPLPPRLGGVRFQKLLHAVWQVADVRESECFYRETLGFTASDWIERKAVFMRCEDRYHHSLAFLQSEEPGKFDHVCFEVESIDDVMRGRNHALEKGVILRKDLLRHAPSGSMGIYMIDPVHNHAVEFCTGHAKILNDDHRARILAMTPESSNIWLEKPPSSEGLPPSSTGGLKGVGD
jgi:2,3-dihydroxy-p-cumate/2,3-dihydroxybenzoate 3,4-dioxygenase